METEAVARRVHFAKEAASESSSKAAAAASPEPESEWKIRALDATPPPSAPPSELAVSECTTPASGGWLESVRKVDDLRSRLESLEEALREMESKAVEQLDKHLQEKVLATAMKLVERRFSDRDLDQHIQQQVLNTAMKLVKQRGISEEGAPAAVDGELCKKLELDFAPRPQEGPEAGQAPPPLAGPDVAAFEAYAAHIEAGFGEVVRRLEIKVDALQYLADNDVFGALEARVTEVLGALEERVAALEGAAAAPGTTAGTGEARLAALEAAVREQQASVAAVLRSVGMQGAPELPAASDASDCTGASSPSTAAASPEAGAQWQGPAAASQLRRRKAGAALQTALQTAKEQVARSEAMAASARAARRPWWAVALHVLGWAVVVLFGLAACLAGAVAVGVQSGRLQLPMEFLS